MAGKSKTMDVVAEATIEFKWTNVKPSTEVEKFAWEVAHNPEFDKLKRIVEYYSEGQNTKAIVSLQGGKSDDAKMYASKAKGAAEFLYTLAKLSKKYDTKLSIEKTSNKS